MIVKESPNMPLEVSSLQGNFQMTKSEGMMLLSKNQVELDFQLVTPQLPQELLPQRCHSMSVQIIPPIGEPKVTKTTHQLIKTKSMRVI